MKKTLAVIFDATTKTQALHLISSLPTDKYFALPLYITPEGKWLFFDHIIENTDSSWEKFGTNAILSPDKTHGGFLRLVGGSYKSISCDAVIPLAKPTNITALCRLAGIECLTQKSLECEK